MKTLCVSDLDGTLFNSEESVSDYTARVLNRRIGEGMLFTVATARMPYEFGRIKGAVIRRSLRRHGNLGTLAKFWREWDSGR